MATHWTQQEDDLLRELYQFGVSSEKIGEILGRTPKAVIYRAAVSLKLRRPYKEVVGIKRQRTEYLDCMPNPFENLKKPTFNINFYRTL